jgi:predicted AAA+ superfamily ATPase
MAGPIFETAGAMEVFKRYTHRGGFPRLYFWRTSAGAEVDLLIENGQQIIPVEIKTTTTLWPSLGDPIRTFFKDFPDRATRGYVIHPGDQKTGIGHNVYAYPFADF